MFYFVLYLNNVHPEQGRVKFAAQLLVKGICNVSKLILLALARQSRECSTLIQTNALLMFMILNFI